MRLCDAQVAHQCTNDRWVLTEDGRFGSLQINSAGSITFRSIGSPIAEDIRAMGYRTTDDLIYAINRAGTELYTIDATATVRLVAELDLPPALQYDAGDVNRHGTEFVVIGSRAGKDLAIIEIDLTDPDYAWARSSLPGTTHMLDISLDKETGVLWGYSDLDRSFVILDYLNLTLTQSPPIDGADDMQGMYYDAWDRHQSIGTIVGGVGGAIFGLRDDGTYRRLSTGGPILIADAASCPWSVDIAVDADNDKIFPCEEFELRYDIINQTGQTQTGINLEAQLDDVLTLTELTTELTVANNASSSDRIDLRGITLPVGKHQIILTLTSDDVSARELCHQAELTGLATRLGGTRSSDDLLTRADDDCYDLELIRIEEDSVRLSYFICTGDEIELDASSFGNQLIWSTGSRSSSITVSTGGEYIVEAQSGCQSVTVLYDVTQAICPYTLELHHRVLPDSILPCSEVIFQYYIDNSTGETRSDLILTDQLPPGYSYLGIASDAYEATHATEIGSRDIEIRDITVPVGIDTINLRVYVDDVSPGEYKGQATLSNIPQELGPFRLSDDPATSVFDSTTWIILGVEEDSLIVLDSICDGAILRLDASSYGAAFLWQDGSVLDHLDISAPGRYELTVFSGCQENYVSFLIDRAPGIDVRSQLDQTIRLGKSTELQPTLYSETDSLGIFWSDPQDTTLSCRRCATPVAFPLRDITYQLTASNEYCSDSININISVDNSRLIYQPNVFSPNSDGINDYFMLHTADHTEVLEWNIIDRWGNTVYRSTGYRLDQESLRWDGTYRSQLAPEGVYIWTARLRFLDGLVETWSGDVTLLR